MHFDILGVRYLDQWQRAPGSRGTSVLTNEGSFWAAWLVRRRGFIDVVGRSVGGRWPSVYRKPRMFFWHDGTRGEEEDDAILAV